MSGIEGSQKKLVEVEGKRLWEGVHEYDQIKINQFESDALQGNSNYNVNLIGGDGAARNYTSGMDLDDSRYKAAETY